MSLYIVGTPIGNLEDITYRAARVIAEADFVVAEDPNHTRKLLNHLGLTKKLVRYHQQSRPAELAQIIGRLAAGESCALVTDAGTPGVADPAGLLVAEARKAGIDVVPIPGVSAVTTLLSVAGIPTDSYMFIGFLPKKKGRATLMTEMANIGVPMVLFESPNRIAKTCLELSKYLGEEREVIIGRELTKVHEEIVKTTLVAAAARWAKVAPKGEITLIVAPE
jgi:16S rRNA (cytidine1402-2'-O)-methyltransferase